MKAKIYLAGHTGEHEYRNYATKKYGKKVDIADPLVQVEQLIDPEEIKKVVNHEKFFNDEQKEKIVVGDKNLIPTCDVLVAYMNKYTCGTCMEILHAFNVNVPVFVIEPQKILRNDVWLSYHTNKFFDTIDDCFKYIIEMQEKCDE